MAVPGPSLPQAAIGGGAGAAGGAGAGGAQGRPAAGGCAPLRAAPHSPFASPASPLLSSPLPAASARPRRRQDAAGRAPSEEWGGQARQAARGRGRDPRRRPRTRALHGAVAEPPQPLRLLRGPGHLLPLHEQLRRGGRGYGGPGRGALGGRWFPRFCVCVRPPWALWAARVGVRRVSAIPDPALVWGAGASSRRVCEGCWRLLAKGCVRRLKLGMCSSGETRSGC